jgi:NAD(P)-dependent dehydrogenase (short-subunit alcohol dehydrogenase family)
VTDHASIVPAFEKLAQQAGKINVFVSNVGVYAEGAVATSAPDEFMKTFEGNVRGTLNAFQAFLPHAAQGAVVLSTTSGAVHAQPFMQNASYAASKAATAKLVEFFGYEHLDLHVVQVQPGIILTEMNTFFAQDQGQTAALKGDV